MEGLLRDACSHSLRAPYMKSVLEALNEEEDEEEDVVVFVDINRREDNEGAEGVVDEEDEEEVCGNRGPLNS